MLKPKAIYYNFSTYGELTLEYAQYGDGKVAFFAFHGFGRPSSDFEVFLPYLGKDYTLYSFHIFHHGNSQYPEDRIDRNTLQQEELGAFFRNFLSENNITAFNLIGYSLGGKVALSIAQLLPDQLDRVILLAPDGIYINKWYKFAARTRFGNWVYRTVHKHPKSFLNFVNGMRKTRLLSEKMHRFIHIHMDTKEKREQVYKVWMTFRNVDPDIAVITRQLNEGKYRCLLIFGKYDRVIPVRIGKEFEAKAEKGVTLKIREAGHLLLDEKSGKLIESWI